MQMFNGLTMWVFDTYRVLLDAKGPETQWENADNKWADAYNKVMEELRQLEDQNKKEDDEVMLANKDLNNALRDYLISNPNNLAELKSKVDQLNPTLWEKWWKGFAILVKFLEKIENQSEEDFKEFMNKLDDPKKLSNMNKNEIDRVKTYIENNKAKAKELYIKMKTVDLEKYKKIDQKDKDVFNGVREVIKTKYNNDPDFLKEDFKDLNSSVSSLKKYAYNDWEGEDLEDGATLQNFDQNKTIISKAFFIETFNNYNEERENRMKDATITGCYDKLSVKYDFQKTSDNKLQYRLNGSEQEWTSIDEDGITELDGIKVLIEGQNDLVNEGEWDRLLDVCKYGIYQELLDNADEAVTTPEVVADKKGPASPEATPKTTIDLYGMSSLDFAAMTKALWDAMFISETKTESETSYSYDIDKVKAYLKTCKDNPEKFTLNGTSYESKNLVRRRAWISAVQILINEKNWANWEKLVVDWKFWTDTKAKVIAFQKNYNDHLPNWAVKLGVDGIPWKDTIQVLLDGKIGDTILEWQWHIDENGKIDFDNWTEIKEENGRKYIEVDWKKYYEYRSGMNWLWYYSTINIEHIGYLYVGNFKNGNFEWQWTRTWADWDKYEWQWKNDKSEWQWTRTWANWDKYEWQWKNNKREWQWTYTWANWDKYEWNWENGNRKWEWTYTWKESWTQFKWEWENDERPDSWTCVLNVNGDKITCPVTLNNENKKREITDWDYKGKYINSGNWELEQ